MKTFGNFPASLILLLFLATLAVAYAQYERKPCVGCIAADAIGAQKTIVVLVEFQDVKHSVSSEAIHNRIFGEMNAYYREMSYGATWLEGDITQWYVLPNPLSYYAVSPYNMKVDRTRVKALVKDAVNAADNDVDFSNYPRVIIVVGAVTTAGKGYGMTGYAAIPGMLGYNVRLETKSGEVIKGAIVAAENAHFGVIAHDYAHMLGGVVGDGRPVEDLYDYDLQSTPGKMYGYAQFYHIYMGYWDIMSSHIIQRDLSPPGMSSFTKMRLGWISPSQIVVVPTGQIATVKLEPLESRTSGTLVVKIPLTTSAYYLLENRQQVGYDAVLPGSGVLILYVDESIPEGNGPVRVVSKTEPYPRDVSFEHGPGKNVAKEVPYLNDAALDINNPIFIDSKNNLSIHLLKNIDSSYMIDVTAKPTTQESSKPEEERIGGPLLTQLAPVFAAAIVIVLIVAGALKRKKATNA